MGLPTPEERRREVEAIQDRTLEQVRNMMLVTVFVFFRNVREWGFHCPRGWVPWQQFVASDNPGAIGTGCGED